MHLTRNHPSRLQKLRYCNHAFVYRCCVFFSCCIHVWLCVSCWSQVWTHPVDSSDLSRFCCCSSGVWTASGQQQDVWSDDGKIIPPAWQMPGVIVTEYWYPWGEGRKKEAIHRAEKKDLFRGRHPRWIAAAILDCSVVESQVRNNTTLPRFDRLWFDRLNICNGL